MKILLIGHACSPHRGSEPGFTWNWAWHLSQKHNVWVITYPQYRQEIEEFLMLHKNPNLKFHYTTLRGWDPWNPTRGERGIRLHYLRWQQQVLKDADQLNNSFQFDIVHHVSWGTIGAPPLVWKLPLPFVWGPIGGGQLAPANFQEFFGKTWITEVIRAQRLMIGSKMPNLVRAARASSLILATNDETKKILVDCGASKVCMFLDAGLPASYFKARQQINTYLETDKLTLFWAGRLESRKGLPLILRAMAVEKNVPVHLLVAGDGPMSEVWKKEANTLGIGDKVSFLGKIPWEDMSQFFMQANAFVFTSLRDSFGSVVLEAMAHGLPIITLNHQGVGSFVPPDTAIKVDVTIPSETINQLAKALRKLYKNPSVLTFMSKASRLYAEEQSWEKRADRMLTLYDEVLHAHSHL